jgi:hypothetical protein
LAHVTRDLGVAEQIVHELGIGCAKNALHQRAEPSLGGRTGLLGAFVARQQGLEIRAAELRPPIHHQALRQPVVPADALPQDHHAAAITGLLEVDVDGQYAARERIDHQRHPRPTKRMPASRIRQFDVQLCVVKVADFKRPVSVPRRLKVKFVIEGHVLISCTRPLSL